MSLLGNIIWLIFGGLLSCLVWCLGGALLCLTVVGIPFGVAAFKVGLSSLAPFGKEIHVDPSFSGPLKIVFNLIWVLLFGWELALLHLGHAAVLAVTIIGLPFAFQHLKLIPISLLPFGQSLR